MSSWIAPLFVSFMRSLARGCAFFNHATRSATLVQHRNTPGVSCFIHATKKCDARSTQKHAQCAFFIYATKCDARSIQKHAGCACFIHATEKCDARLKQKHAGDDVVVEALQRFGFYKRAEKAFAIVQVCVRARASRACVFVCLCVCMFVCVCVCVV